MGEIAGPALEQVVTQLPILVVCLVAIVLALVFWRRSPGVSVLVLVAASLLLLVSVACPFAFQIVLKASSKEDWNSEKTALVMGVIGVAYSVIHAAVLGLLVAAAFAGRPAPSESFEDLM